MTEQRILRKREKRRVLRTFGLVTLIIGVLGALGALLVRDQISRHRRNLFSPYPLRRLAALGYLAGMEPNVDAVRLLRDYVAWEPRPVLRRRGEQVLMRMERRVRRAEPTAGGAAG